MLKRTIEKYLFYKEGVSYDGFEDFVNSHRENKQFL
jgi:hypothetical protein